MSNSADSKEGTWRPPRWIYFLAAFAMTFWCVNEEIIRRPANAFLLLLVVFGVLNLIYSFGNVRYGKAAASYGKLRVSKAITLYAREPMRSILLLLWYGMVSAWLILAILLLPLTVR